MNHNDMTDRQLAEAKESSSRNIYLDILHNIYMGKLLMLQEADDERIEHLKTRLAISRKIDVVRAGMDLLEKEAERRERIARWTKAASRVAAESRRVNAAFRTHSRLKRSSL